MSQKVTNATNLYLEGIRDGNYEDAVDKYTGERYIQHSTGVKDGKEGFIEFFSGFVKRNPKRKMGIVRALEDGPYVFLHVFQSLNDGEYLYVTTDFFDTDENDKVIEHWDVISEYQGKSPLRQSAVGGPTELKDLDKTEQNKILVRNFIQDVLMKGGSREQLSQYISNDKFVEHNFDGSENLEHFQNLLSESNRSYYYEEIVLLVGQGNFVATLCKSNNNDGITNQDYAQVDIFRVENGKIVEHWDNVEPVPKNDVNSGKF